MDEIVRNIDTLERGIERAGFQRVGGNEFDIFPTARFEDLDMTSGGSYRESRMYEIWDKVCTDIAARTENQHAPDISAGGSHAVRPTSRSAARVSHLVHGFLEIIGNQWRRQQIFGRAFIPALARVIERFAPGVHIVIAAT